LTESILASLFFEIGRFKKRAIQSDEDFVATCRNWLSSLGIPNLVQIALDLDKSASVFQKAACLSLGRNELPDETGAPIALESTFSRISLTKQPSKTFYKLTHLSEEANFPLGKPEVADKLSAQYMKLWQQFENDLISLKDHLNPENVLVLLEKYCSFIPYHSSFPDISLYDQAKMTAAIVSCLEFKGLDSISPFLLLGGDFSGVQEFIYTISTKGALKGLRGRSFFLEFFAEHVIYEIIHQLNLSRANLLFCGGARFNLLLPNTSKTKEIIAQLQNGVNDYFRKDHDIKLYLVLEYVEFMEAHFRGAGLSDKYEELGHKINLHKKKKFANNLEKLFFAAATKNAEIQKYTETWKDECPRCGKKNSPKIKWDIDSYEVWGCEVCLPDKITIDECSICYKEDYTIALPYPFERFEEDGGEEIPTACPSCCDLFHIGEHLTDTKYILRSTSRPELAKVALKLQDAWYILLPRGSERNKLFENAEAVWLINEFDVPNYTLYENTIPLLLANFRPRNIKGKDLTFEWLAEQSIGTNRLGILRLDMDNLGNIITGNAISEIDKSMLRISALSRSLSLFFKFYIKEFCEGNSLPAKYGKQVRIIPQDANTARNVIIIYSGGDDAFLVGSWSDIAELAFDINHAFRGYVGENPDITFSAGVILSSPDYPLYRFAEESKRAEKAAKKNQKNGRKKDSFAPFYESYIFSTEGHGAATFWQNDNDISAENILTLAHEIADEFGNRDNKSNFELKAGARAFIYKLLSVIDIKRERGKLYLPALAYTLARTNISEGLENKLLDANTIKYLHPAVKWIELLAREK